MTRRAGFSLVEIIVGMVLFSVVLLGLGGLQIIESRKVMRESVLVRATAMLTARTGGWQVADFGSLPALGITGSCMIDTTSAPGGFRFFRCDTVTVVNADERTISVNVLAPLSQKPGAVTRIPEDSTLVAAQFVRLNARLQRSRQPATPF